MERSDDDERSPVDPADSPDEPTQYRPTWPTTELQRKGRDRRVARGRYSTFARRPDSIGMIDTSPPFVVSSP